MALEQEATLSETAINGTTQNEQNFLSTPSQQALAKEDVRQGFLKWRIWFLLAYQDIKLRYRRSVLGPFWLTISMAITVYSMGFLYGHLFHIELDTYYPFLVAGMLGWSLISTMVIDYTDGLLAAEPLIKQLKLPYSVHIHRIAMRNMIIFFHNILVLIPIYVFFHKTARISLTTLLIIPSLLVIYFNSITYGIILSMLGARYRDISQVIKSLVQIVFFVTPVMWSPAVLTGRTVIGIDLNPFYAFLEILRKPLLGGLPTLNNLYMVIVTTLIGVAISSFMFIRYRSRIVYWL